MASEPQKLSNPIQQTPFAPPAPLSETDPPSHTDRLMKGGLPTGSLPRDSPQPSDEAGTPYNAEPIRVGSSDRHVEIKPSAKRAFERLQEAADDPASNLEQITVRVNTEDDEDCLKRRSWLQRKLDYWWYGNKTPLPLLDESGQVSSIVKTWVEEQLYSLKHDSSIWTTTEGEELFTEADWLNLRDDICNDLNREGSKPQGSVPNNGPQSWTKQAIEAYARRAINDVAKAAHDLMWRRAHNDNAQMFLRIDDVLSEFKAWSSLRFLGADDWYKIGIGFYEEAQRVHLNPPDRKQLRSAAVESVWSHVMHLQKERFDILLELYKELPDENPSKQTVQQIDQVLKELKAQPFLKSVDAGGWDKVGVECYEAQRGHLNPPDRKQLRRAVVDSVWVHVWRLQRERYDALLKLHSDLLVIDESEKTEQNWKKAVEEAKTAIESSKKAYQQAFLSEEIVTSSEQLPDGDDDDGDEDKDEYHETLYVKQLLVSHTGLVSGSLATLERSGDFEARKKERLWREIEWVFPPMKGIEGLDKLEDTEWVTLQETFLEQCWNNDNHDQEYISSSACEMAAKRLLQWQQDELKGIEEKETRLVKAGLILQEDIGRQTGSSFVTINKAAAKKKIGWLQKRIESNGNLTIDGLSLYATKVAKQLQAANKELNRLEQQLADLTEKPKTYQQDVDRILGHVPQELLQNDLGTIFAESRKKIENYFEQGKGADAAEELESMDELVLRAKEEEKAFDDYRKNLNVLDGQAQLADRFPTEAAIAIAKALQPADFDYGFSQNSFRYAVAVVKSFKDFAASATGQAMIARLEQFAGNASLVKALNSVDEPYSDGRLNNSIRAMLGIRLYDRVDELHARRAVLAAVLHGVPGDASIEWQISTFKQLVDGTLKAGPGAKDDDFQHRQIKLTVPNLDTEKDRGSRAGMIFKAVSTWFNNIEAPQSSDRLLASILSDPNVYANPDLNKRLAKVLLTNASQIANPNANEITIDLADLLNEASKKDFAMLEREDGLLDRVAQHDRMSDEIRRLEQNPSGNEEELRELKQKSGSLGIQLMLRQFSEDYRTVSLSVQDRVDYLRARIETYVDGRNLLVEAYQNIDRSGIDNNAGDAATVTTEAT